MITNRLKISRGAMYLILIAISTATFFPFLWMVSTAFKPASEVFQSPPNFIPQKPTLSNFIIGWSILPFGRIFFNTTFITVTRTVLSAFLASLAGYAFAKYRFWGHKFFFLLILATLMIPFQLTMIPVFLLLGKIGWLNTYQGLIFPGVAQAFGVFLMRQYFRTIPTELIEVSRLDGASEFRIFFQIILPLAKPALAVLAIFSFQGSWNEFLLPLIVVESDWLLTIQLGLSKFRGELWTDWGQLMAMTLISIIPVMIVFLAFQKHFIKGISLTGTRG